MTKYVTIGKWLERNAELKREQAVEHRDDVRHGKAAQIMDGLAAQFAAGDVDPELWAKYEALEPGGDEIGAVMGMIGFDRFPNTADQFLAILIEETEASRV